jgi:hypothetical protein
MSYLPQEDEYLFLLGAGCSKDAGIPMSGEMVNDIEQLVTNAGWREYKDLYFYLKSSILYSDGIHGEFEKPLFSFNIEKLLVVISEIEKKERNLIYPFIGTWDHRLLELAGSNFKNLKEFKEKINERLGSEWIKFKNIDDVKYYEGFMNLQNECGQSLRIFNLNYDLCLERTSENKNMIVQDGFDISGNTWN